MRRLVLAVSLLVAFSAGSQPTWLPQNWSPADSQWYYTTPQGSKLILYSWALALERAESQELWSQNLDRFYFLPNPAGDANPDGLPVGIVRDDEHLGLTCAACHTNQLVYRGITYQIDGAPADADLYAFLASLAKSVGATSRSPVDPKFLRFAARVLGSGNTPAARSKLFGQLTQYNSYFQRFLIASTPTIATWGRARTDAFGEIFNRVTAIDLKIPSNSRTPNAPVSYPFLWDTSWLDKVQWNGIADNRNVVERLARNVGEVLGVFAQIDLRKPTLFHWYYESTAKRLNLIDLEDQLSKLRSPKWPAAFGTLDPARVAAGKALYNSSDPKLNCAGCHYIATPGAYQNVVLTPLSEIGTDPGMTSMVATRIAGTGVLQGVRTMLLFGPRMKSIELAGTITGNAVIGAILSPVESEGTPTRRRAARGQADDGDDRDDPARDRLRAQLMAGPRSTEQGMEGPPHSDLRAELETSLIAMGARTMQRQATRPEPVYKARPLDGIWATAPYLHNGSVPTLYDLLSKPAARPATFWVGTRQFDPSQVGFMTAEAAGAFLFDTRIVGNLNTGHEWGTDLSETDKWALIEYLKSL